VALVAVVPRRARERARPIVVISRAPAKPVLAVLATQLMLESMPRSPRFIFVLAFYFE